MASDYLLEIDGIKGESQDDKHKEAIEIMSFSWGASNPGSFASGAGGGAGKVSFSDINFMTQVSKASPELFTACATGKHIKKAVLFVRKSGETPQEYYKLTLEDCLLSSVQHSGSSGGSDLPTESFSVNFAKYQFEYSPQNADGSLGSPVISKYDLKAAKK